MKKISIFTLTRSVLITLLITMLLSGCMSNNNPSNSDTPNESGLQAGKTADPISTSTDTDTITQTQVTEAAIFPLTTSRQKDQRITIKSAELAKNTVGYDGEKSVTVTLPPSYETSTTHYPVIYFLAGFGESTGEYMKEYGSKLIWEAMNQGKLEESILVTMDGGCTVSCSFYADSSILGNWETFIATDLVNAIDTNFRTLKNPNARGIVGYATGGNGAFQVAMKYPDVFSAVYCYNPALADENGVQSYILGSTVEQKETLNFLATQEGQSPQALALSTKSFELYSPMNIRLCYGLSYAASSDGNKLLYPFVNESNDSSQESLTLIPENMALWQNGFGNGATKIKQYGQSLKKLKGIALEYGKNEENLWIINGTLAYAAAMTDEKIPFVLNTNVGGHYDYDLMAINHVETVVPFFDNLLER